MYNYNNYRKNFFFGIRSSSRILVEWLNDDHYGYDICISFIGVAIACRPFVFSSGIDVLYKIARSDVSNTHKINLGVARGIIETDRKTNFGNPAAATDTDRIDIIYILEN